MQICEDNGQKDALEKTLL